MSHPTSDAGWIDLAGTELTADQKIRADALRRAALISAAGKSNANLFDLADSCAAYIRDGAS